MPRAARNDPVLIFMHAGNRGVAQRVIFEGERDVRCFLSLVARAVRAGWIEVHAYAILPNHFHLLVRSLVPGGLARAMKLIEGGYAQYFNRTRGRDGPLFRGRYWSEEIHSYRYWLTVVGYIDQNAVRAGLVARAGDYPWNSAWHYVRARGPRWLTRDRVEAALEAQLAVPGPGPRDYEGVFAQFTRPVHVRRVERGMRPRTPSQVRLDDLMRRTSPELRDWFDSRARMADGTLTSLVLVDIDTVLALTNGSDPLNRTVRTGLLRSVCGLSARETALRLGIGSTTVHRESTRHRELLRTNEAYADQVARLFRAALDRDHPPLPSEDWPW